MHSKKTLAVVLALLIVLVGCGDDKKQPTLTNITVSAVSLSPALGTTTQLSASGTFSNGSSQALSGVSWSTSNAAVATVDATGLVTTRSRGTAIITATMNGMSATITITVGPPVLSSLSISPTTPSVALGRAQQFNVTGTMTDGSAATGLTLTWTSSNSAVATVAAGLVTSKTQGTTTITASSGSITTSTTLTVTAPVISSIAITPADPSIAAGAQQQFVATATLTDTTTRVVTSTATWHSGDTAIATVDPTNAGLLHAVAVGTTQISATQDGVAGNTSLTVTSNTASAVAFLFATGYDQVQNTYLLKTYAVPADGTMHEIGSRAVDTTTGRMVTDGSRFLYIDSAGNGGILGFAIDRNTGGLTALPSYTPPQGTSVERIAMDPSAARIYGFDAISAQAAIKVLNIDQATGALTDTGLSYPIAGSGLPNSGHNNALFVTNQNGTFFYFGGGNGSCATYGGSGPCMNLHGYHVDAVTGALSLMGGSPFESWSPQVWSMATSSDQTVLWLSLDAYRIASYSLDPLSGTPGLLQHWFPLGQGAPIPAMVPRSNYFYAGQSTNLLWITPNPTTKLLPASGWWTYTNPAPVTDIALFDPAGQLFVSDFQGVSSFNLDNVGQPTFNSRVAFNGAEHVILIAKPN